MCNNKVSSALLLLCLTAPLAQAYASQPVIQIQREARLQHAKELLGKYYAKSVVAKGEKVSKINSEIYRWSKERLPAKFKNQYRKVAQAVIDSAAKYGFDPVFLLSVMQHESSFNPRCKGSLDEIGLMQLRPGTAEWIAQKYDLPYSGAKTLFDPATNIRLGAAYLNYLRESFDSQAQLYISAYNMGSRNVSSYVEKKVWPKEYAMHVMHYYLDFYQNMKLPKRNRATI
jgi:soluble lytic murein transglycosylase